MVIGEASIYSPVGIPVWQIKMMIPIGAVLLLLQGVAEVLRCLICLRDDRWPPRLHDVEELEDQILHEHASGQAEGTRK
jgi:TRAP-type mannitol/chloroaromatic compound transport system permease small subunit